MSMQTPVNDSVSVLETCCGQWCRCWRQLMIQSQSWKHDLVSDVADACWWFRCGSRVGFECWGFSPCCADRDEGCSHWDLRRRELLTRWERWCFYQFWVVFKPSFFFFLHFANPLTSPFNWLDCKSRKSSAAIHFVKAVFGTGLSQCQRLVSWCSLWNVCSVWYWPITMSEIS